LPETLNESPTKFLEVASAKHPFVLHNGVVLGPIVIAYETWGRLNEAKDNAILVFHALSGSQHAAGFDPVGPGTGYWTPENHTGWWDGFIGPGKALDTDRFFVICCNYLGGCYGSTGPCTNLPGTGRPFGRAFPFPSISDNVDMHLRVLDHLGIDRLHAAIGGSMGGFCVMDLAVRYPDRVHCVIPIASGLRATVLAKALNFEQIFAIAEDRNFRGGDYYGHEPPWRGLALARMISHKTYISLEYMEQRARNVIIQPDDLLAGYLLEHRIESYLLHKGKSFVERFDANTYLRIINMWQSFDLPAQVAHNNITQTFAPCRQQRWLLFTISSDACFYPCEQVEIAQILKANGIDHQYITVHSDKGHDSFLLEPDLYAPQIRFNLMTN